MKRKSKVPEKLLRDLARNQKMAQHFSENGQRDTLYHQNVARLERAIAKYNQPEPEPEEETLDGPSDV